MAVPEPWWIGVDDDVDRLWRAGSSQTASSPTKRELDSPQAQEGHQSENRLLPRRRRSRAPRRGTDPRYNLRVARPSLTPRSTRCRPIGRNQLSPRQRCCDPFKPPTGLSRAGNLARRPNPDDMALPVRPAAQTTALTDYFPPRNTQNGQPSGVELTRPAASESTRHVIPSTARPLLVKEVPWQYLSPGGSASTTMSTGYGVPVAKPTASSQTA